MVRKKSGTRGRSRKSHGDTEEHAREIILEIILPHSEPPRPVRVTGFAEYLGNNIVRVAQSV